MVSPWLTVSIRSISSSCSTRRRALNVLLERAMVVESPSFLISLTKPKYLIRYITIVPFYKTRRKTFRRTALDYFITAMFLAVFVWAFFFGSKWGDMHYTSMGDDPGLISEINMQVILAPLILIYELFQLVILPGKTRLKYLPWRFWLALFVFMVYKKIKTGIQEYKNWRSNPHHE